MIWGVGAYIDLVLVVLLRGWSAEQISESWSGELEDLLGADQEEKEENPEEQVDQVQEESHVESLLVIRLVHSKS